MTPLIANADELYVAPGGPMYRWMHRLSQTLHAGHLITRRIIITLMITWLPMCAFAFLQGIALGPSPHESFLLDFATYARFFIGIPVLIMADDIIGSRMRQAGLRFVDNGLVGPDDYPGFERAVANLARRRESVVATIIIVLLAVLGAWQFTYESVSGAGAGGWQSITLPEDHSFHWSLAAIWNHVVAVPVMLFLWYRWVWRIVIWALFLRDMARLNLRLIASHADRAGGLGFLTPPHQAFCVFAFVVGSTLSAGAAFRIVYEGASIDIFQLPVLVVVIVMQVVFLGPLLFFTPTMVRARKAGLAAYGSLVMKYNRSFQDKWMEGTAPPGESLLGSADIQSMADMGNTFRFVEDMRYTPIDKWTVMQIAVATLLPGLPLVFLAIPLTEILKTLKGVAL